MDEELPSEIGNRFGDLSDLPEGLLRQIPAVRMDDLEREILDLIKHRFGGAASVDEVLVGLYRQSGAIHERKKIAGKLYRMVTGRPKHLDAVKDRRGVYRIP